MPPVLHERLRKEAARSGLSLNQLCLRRLETGDRVGAADFALVIPAVLRRQIMEQWRAELVGLVVFGSASRGDADSASDVDLLLVFDPDARLCRELYHEWDRVVSSSQLSPQFVRLPRRVKEAGGLWYEVAIEGLVLWERDLRVSRFLSRIREAMARGEIRRALAHGQPYWVRQLEDRNEK